MLDSKVGQTRCVIEQMSYCDAIGGRDSGEKVVEGSVERELSAVALTVNECRCEGLGNRAYPVVATGGWYGLLSVMTSI